MDRSLLQQKIAFGFSKTGIAKFYSHHDLMRHFERSLNRSGLKPRLSSGFNPRPRMVFSHPLPLGLASKCEEIEIEFCEKNELKDIFSLIKAEVEPVIELTSCIELKPVKRTRLIAKCDYEITGFSDMDKLKNAIEQMLQAEEIKVWRGHARKRRQVEVRQYIVSAEVIDNGFKIELLHKNEGAGRADEIARYISEKLDLDVATLQLTKVNMEFK